MQIEIKGKNFIAGLASSSGTETFSPDDPRTEAQLGPAFSIATASEVAQACQQARKAFEIYKTWSSEQKANLLEKIALGLGEVSEVAKQRAGQETALPAARLTGELARTQNQLRLYADALRKGDWLDARIDHGDPTRQPIPKPDLRRMLRPLGPVAVFGASNFPFAFSVAGGDTASALAAGCPVIFKAHPAHPGTSEIVASVIYSAIAAAQAPPGIFSMVHGAAAVGSALVQDPEIQALAFTGSFAVGDSLARLAATRDRPIPVYAEMGSINPMVFLPGALTQNEKISADYAASLTMGVGQFCTNPGLVIGIGEPFARFVDEVKGIVAGASPGVMLTHGIRANYERLTDAVASVLGDQSSYKLVLDDGTVAPTLFRTTAKLFLSNPSLVEEVFGPSAIAVNCENEEELFAVLDRLPGQLTASLHATIEEQDLAKLVVDRLETIAGRIIYNGYPTGVEVGQAMQHGGPYPATTDSRSTSVGSAAILRFARPIAYQDWPDALLPSELQEANPLRIRRLVDGSFKEN